MTSDNARLRYSMIIQWSNEVDAFLVALPEWKSRVINTYVTHGETYEEAVKNGREVLEMLVEDGVGMRRGTARAARTCDRWLALPRTTRRWGWV